MEERPENILRSQPLPWWNLPLKFLLGQWQTLGIGVAVLLAWLFPDVGRKGGVVHSQYTTAI